MFCPLKSDQDPGSQNLAFQIVIILAKDLYSTVQKTFIPQFKALPVE